MKYVCLFQTYCYHVIHKYVIDLIVKLKLSCIILYKYLNITEVSIKKNITEVKSQYKIFSLFLY